MKIVNKLAEIEQGMINILQTQRAYGSSLKILQDIVINAGLITRKDFDRLRDEHLKIFGEYLKLRSEMKQQGKLKTFEEEQAYKKTFDDTYEMFYKQVKEAYEKCKSSQ